MGKTEAFLNPANPLIVRLGDFSDLVQHTIKHVCRVFAKLINLPIYACDVLFEHVKALFHALFQAAHASSGNRAQTEGEERAPEGTPRRSLGQPRFFPIVWCLWFG